MSSPQLPSPKRYYPLCHSYSKHINTTVPFAHPYRHCPQGTSQAAHSSTSGAETTASDVSLLGIGYPNMVGCNRIVFDSTEPDYYRISQVIISTDESNSDCQAREGELTLRCGPTTILTSWTDIVILYSQPSISIQGSSIPIQCSKVDAFYVSRSKELLGNLRKLKASTRPTYTQNIQPGDSGQSDSGDENVPLAPSITSSFSIEDVAIINHLFGEVWRHYKTIRSFTNGPGKYFMEYLIRYLGCVFGPTSPKFDRFQCMHSTTSGGSGPISEKDTQAGSSKIKRFVLKHDTRAAGPKYVCTDVKRYSDTSTFDHEKQWYIKSGEIKSSNDAASHQNLEQMIGLWRAEQKFILGYTVNPSNIHFRLLVREEDSFYPYTLMVNNTINNLIQLGEVYIAFLLMAC